MAYAIAWRTSFFDNNGSRVLKSRCSNDGPKLIDVVTLVSFLRFGDEVELRLRVDHVDLAAFWQAPSTFVSESDPMLV